MQLSEQRIEIPLNKKKITIMLLGALIFVAIGFWFVIAPPEISNSYWGDHTKIKIVGCLSILFFGLCAFVLIKKLPDRKPGLIIDQNGLTDNSGGNSAGEILWTDIKDLSVIEIHRQKIILLDVINPKDYIDRQTSVFKRKMMQMNYKMYGTPLSITSNGLKVSFDDLMRLLTDKLHQSTEK
jgi:hypothetical protein